MTARFLLAHLGLLALLSLIGCKPNLDLASSNHKDAPVMPKIEGCAIERHVVDIPTSLGISQEVVYVARCAPMKTVSTAVTRNCGKNCTQRITTITTTEGVPEEQKQ